MMKAVSTLNLRKLNPTQAETLINWLTYNGYDYKNMTLRSTIRASREMSEWFLSFFVYYRPIDIVAGILALNNGGEV